MTRRVNSFEYFLSISKHYARFMDYLMSLKKLMTNGYYNSHFINEDTQIHLEQGYQTHFHQGPHQPRGCLQRAECNFRTV